MKFIKYITPALFCAALTLQSCEHFLDTKPMDSKLGHAAKLPE